MNQSLRAACCAALFFQAELSLAACAALEGSLVQGGLVWGEVSPGSRVSLDGEHLDVLENGIFVAG